MLPAVQHSNANFQVCVDSTPMNRGQTNGRFFELVATQSQTASQQPDSVYACWLTLFLCLILSLVCPSATAQQNSRSKTGSLELYRSDAIPEPEGLTPLEAKYPSNARDELAMAGMLDAFVQQHRDPRSIAALRLLQRSLRGFGRSNPDELCLQEILKLAHSLRLRNEFVRYAEFGVEHPLGDAKIALHAAVALTDARKYSVAADYYQKWLLLKPGEASVYLQSLVLIELGRLRYLAREYDKAQSAFRKVLGVLEANLLPPEQKKQLLRNSETTYRMMANTFLKTGDFKTADKLFELSGLDSTSPIQFMNAARVALGKGELKKAKELVLRFIAKQPNHSESYALLREIIQRIDQGNDREVDSLFVEELELIRKKFRSGKVLDDLLVSYYLKLNQTTPAKKILTEQRNDTLWRDRANRQLVDIAFRERNLEELLNAIAIEIDEHETMAGIRTPLRQYRKSFDNVESKLVSIYRNEGPLRKRLAAVCLLLYTHPSGLSAFQQQPVVELIGDQQTLSQRQKIKWLNLLGREFVTQKEYVLALDCFRTCLTLNQDAKENWIDKRIAFDALLSCTFCHCRLNQKPQALATANDAQKVLRYSPSLMHLHAWTHLQFADWNTAIVGYQEFLQRFDKVGASTSLANLIERVRLEMAFAFYQLSKPDLAAEILNQAYDRNPFGPDLDAFRRNNQKYNKENSQFIEFANGVKNGGPFPLGRN